MAKNMKSNRTGETQASASELYDFMKRVRSWPWPSWHAMDTCPKMLPFVSWGLHVVTVVIAAPLSELKLLDDARHE